MNENKKFGEINMSILVSYVGTSDPIRNCYSGPLFCLLRDFDDIEFTYIFLSKAFSKKNENEDDYIARLIKAIKQHEINIGREIKYEIVETELEAVYDYSSVYNYTNKFLINLFNENPDKKYYFNISSGTQQMCITLACLAQTYQNSIDITLLQALDYKGNSKDEDGSVSNLNDKKKNHTFEEELGLYNNYDLERGSRTRKVEIIAFAKNSFLNKINNALDNYLYESIKDFFSDELKYRYKALAFLNHVIYRQQGDFQKAHDILLANKIDPKKYMPYHNNKAERRIEPYLKLKVANKRCNYNDFLVRLFNLINNTLKDMLLKYFNFDYKRYTDKEEKIIFDSLITDYNLTIFTQKNYPYWNFRNLKLLFDEFNKNNTVDKKISLFFDKLFKLNEKRNNAAHDSDDVDLKTINEFISIDEIINKIGSIMIELYDINPKYFDIYDDINKQIQKNLI